MSKEEPCIKGIGLAASGGFAEILINGVSHPPRLISAAPDLYEACQAAKDLLVRDLEEPGRTVFWKLVDALSKARGGVEIGGSAGVSEGGNGSLPIPSEAPVSAGWQVISTAPKDGTVIQARIPGHGEDNMILWVPDALENEKASCGAWAFAHEDQEPPDCWSDGWCWAVNADGVRSAWPSHWKPVAPSHQPQHSDGEG